MDEGNTEKIISPCIDKCVINKEGYCTGCFRSIREISEWAAMTNQERQKIMSQLEERKKTC